MLIERHLKLGLCTGSRGYGLGCAIVVQSSRIQDAGVNANNSDETSPLNDYPQHAWRHTILRGFCILRSEGLTTVTWSLNPKP